MTKAQARKRLSEAAGKIMSVQMAAMKGDMGGINITDVKKLFPIALDLRKIADRMK